MQIFIFRIGLNVVADQDTVGGVCCAIQTIYIRITNAIDIIFIICVNITKAHAGYDRILICILRIICIPNNFCVAFQIVNIKRSIIVLLVISAFDFPITDVQDFDLCDRISGINLSTDHSDSVANAFGIAIVENLRLSTNSKAVIRRILCSAGIYDLKIQRGPVIHVPVGICTFNTLVGVIAFLIIRSIGICPVHRQCGQLINDFESLHIVGYNLSIVGHILPFACIVQNLPFRVPIANLGKIGAVLGLVDVPSTGLLIPAVKHRALPVTGYFANTPTVNFPCLVGYYACNFNALLDACLLRRDSRIVFR